MLIARNIIRKFAIASVKSSLEQIVEFRKLDHFHGKSVDTLAKKIGSKPIADQLNRTKGIYLFYDSSGKVIYCGRTVKNVLLKEMQQAFNLRRPQYKRKLTDAKGNFSNRKLSIRDTAHYFSAYRVDDVLIANLEAFVTRIVPNDLINKKTERII
jgi:hypothetical protein